MRGCAHEIRSLANRSSCRNHCAQSRRRACGPVSGEALFMMRREFRRLSGSSVGDRAPAAQRLRADGRGRDCERRWAAPMEPPASDAPARSPGDCQCGEARLAGGESLRLSPISDDQKREGAQTHSRAVDRAARDDGPELLEPVVAYRRIKLSPQTAAQ
jgi:hypothetical protein